MSLSNLVFFLPFLFHFQGIFAGYVPIDRLHWNMNAAISVYANIPQARSITAMQRHIFVTTQSGSIYYVYPPESGLGDPDRVVQIISGLGISHGIAHHNGNLYFTDRSKVYMVPNILQKIAKKEKINPEIFISNLPDHGEPYHAGKYMRIHGNDMFISVGRPGDVGSDGGGQFGKIIRIDMQTKAMSDYATGLRNSVGMDINNASGHLWFTDNGPDRQGEELPKEEVNEVITPGSFFGFPYTHGGTPISKNPRSGDTVEPVLMLPAHVAPLGMVFYRGPMFPEMDGRVLLIAEHGSWARKNPLGYRISMFRFQANGQPDPAQKYEIFIDGWQDTQTGKVWGRPVDVTVDIDGAIYITDDKKGVVYKFYKKYFELK